MLSKRISVLLASGSASGTIAAVRNLGANGIDVGVMSSHLLSAAAWSRWASRRHWSPPETKSCQFLERLLAIGAAEPGQILLPTSDETAWLYTANAELLNKHFRLYQPSLKTIKRILDKTQLAAAAKRVGIDVLPTWDPPNIGDLEALAPTLPYPILIKPRTHVHRLRNDKGIAAYSAEELLLCYQQFVDRERVRAVNSDMPDADRPILQQFIDVGREGVLSVTGFIDRTGEHFVTRNSTKIFQRSRPVGIGICFEPLPQVTGLSDAIRCLCRELDYFGIFEAEFLWFGDTWAIIDFNPRLFHQVGMDIQRGMPLPILACLDALNERSALRTLVLRAQTEDRTAVFCDRFTLRAILLAQALTARISRRDRLRWLGWLKQNASCAVDAAADTNDPMPALIHALSELSIRVTGFSRFLQSTPRLVDPS